jgi:branched-chain amino acid transport system substrate-binding protein
MLKKRKAPSILRALTDAVMLVSAMLVSAMPVSAMPVSAMLVSAMLAAALLSPLPAAAVGQSEVREVRVGIIADLSGPDAELGNKAARAAELCFEQFNSRGDGPRITTLLADDAGDPGLGAAEVRRLVGEEGAALICGPLSGAVALRAAQAAQELGVPLISPTSTHPALTLTGDCIFRACATDAYQALIAASYARSELEAKRCTVLYQEGDEAGRTQAEVFSREFPALGGEIVAITPFPDGTREFSSRLHLQAGKDPDLLFLPVAWHQAARIAAEAQTALPGVRLLGSGAWDFPDLLKIAPGALEGALLVQQASPESPECRGFVDAYRRSTGLEPDSVALLTYEACLVIADAVLRAGSTEPALLRTALAASDLKTLTGRFRFDSLGNPVRASSVMVIEKGEIVFKELHRVRMDY